MSDSFLVCFAKLFGPAALITACASSRPPPAHSASTPIDEAKQALSMHDCVTARTKARLAEREVLQPEALLVLGACDEVEGHADDAIAEYHDALFVDPKLTEASLRLSTLLLDLGRNDEAAKAARAGLGFAPDRPELHMLLAEALERMGDSEGSARAYAHAAAAWHQAVAAHPDDAMLRVKYARALSVTHEDDRAKSEYLDALSLSSPQSREGVDVILDAASGLSLLGDAQGCVAALDKLLSSSPPSLETRRADALAERAECRYRTHDLDGARADANASLAITPNVPLHLEAARWDEQAGDRNGCARHYAAVVKATTSASVKTEATLGVQRCGG